MITTTDIDNLKDIAWWLKGFAAGNTNSNNRNDFNEDHVDSLTKAVNVMKNKMDEDCAKVE